MMDMFPVPFALGTSAAKMSDVIPAVVHFDEQNSQTVVGVHINDVYYSNKNQSTLKDCNFATIVYHKRTKELMVIHKKPEFLAPCFNETEDTPAVETKRVDRAALTQAFGSAKRQRLLKEIERNADQRSAITDASVITRAMHGQNRLKQEAAEMNSSESAKPVDERTRLLPPFNVNASCPQDVFPLDKLIPSRVLQALASEIDALASVSARSYQQWSKQGVYQSCVLSRLLALSTKAIDVKDTTTTKTAATDRTRIAQCLALVSHMLALYKLSQNDIQRKQPLPDTPLVVAKYLLNEFTVLINRGGSAFLKVRLLSPLLRDRLVYHILALILHCDNFETIIDDLAVDLRMNTDRMKRYFHFMGCRVVKNEVKVNGEQCFRLTASLVTPVRFPDPSTQRSHRKSILS
ncbi:DNA-directed RNA polymerase I subunit RPA49 [Fasciola hepatica]|uniref:DNA-directed RNA polymerase I subunit RPA49 n=1 Tax=Fasciola hepatica TaxID=6192 RepID=A0A4E0RKB1_FASHE|nr:DNA-directed RNA polymerase I subunit RPA49 [Fasciola hepatica]